MIYRLLPIVLAALALWAPDALLHADRTGDAKGPLAALAAIPEVASSMGIGDGEARVLADAADGRLDDCDLLAAALEIEPLGSGARQVACRRLDAIARDMRRALAGVESDRLPAALLDAVHRRALTGRFKADCHRLSRTLATGDFNCLTGTLLVVGLARRCGIEAEALLAASHVFARVASDRLWVEIESTCPAWFTATDALRQRWLADALGAPRSAVPLRAIDDAGLLAVCYFNRGVEAFDQRHYRAAAAASLVALRLDGRNAAARDNLLAALNNLALQTARRGDAARAAAIVKAAQAIDPRRSDLAATERYVKLLGERAALPGPTAHSQ